MKDNRLKSKKKNTTPKVKIREEVFLGEFKIEYYLRREVERISEKYKNE